MSEKFKFSFSGLYDESLDHIEIDGVKFYPEKKHAQLERVAAAARKAQELRDKYNEIASSNGSYAEETQAYAEYQAADDELDAALAEMEPK